MTLHLPKGFEFRKAGPYRVPDDGTLLVYEQKEDGWRACVTRRHCFSRGISKVTGEQIDLGHIPRVAVIQQQLFPEDIIEIELTVPGGVGSDVPMYLKEGADRSVLVPKPFHFSKRKGLWVPSWDASRELLEDWAEDWECELSRIFVYGGPTYYPGDWDKYALANGWEGFIAKVRGENRHHWMKLKLERTIDVVVTGWKTGNGKYLDTVGALEVSIVVDRKPWDYEADVDGVTHRLRVLANCSGMTDDQRDEMLAQGDEMLFRVCEVKAQGHGGKKRLRHPRFKRWRDDKDWRLCDGTS